MNETLLTIVVITSNFYEYVLGNLIIRFALVKPMDLNKKYSFSKTNSVSITSLLDLAVIK